MYKSKSSTSKIKAELIKSLKWKRFRYEMLDYCGNKDAITLKPLRKGWNLHHLCMKEEEYHILSPERFRCLNKGSHEAIHFLFTYYKKDPSILERIKTILDEMVKYNEVEK